MLLNTASSKGAFHIDNDLLNHTRKVCAPNFSEVKNISSFCILSKAPWNTSYTCYNLYSFLFHLILMINLTKSLSSYQVTNMSERCFQLLMNFWLNFLIWGIKNNLEHIYIYIDWIHSFGIGVLF